MTTETYVKPALYREYPPPHSATSADAALAFGRFRVLLRQRQLVADGVPIELGTRALDLLLVLLKADGSPVTKDELLTKSCVARHCCRGGELEGSDLRIAQGSW
jgi:DNA-binding response OmpR family regulator